MPSDIRETLREAAPTPNGRPDTGRILARGRRLRWRRRSLILCMALVLATGAWIGVDSVIQPGETQFSPAGPGEGSGPLSSEGSNSNYVFTGMEVREATDPVSGERLDGTAVINFVLQWSEAEFPGWHQCTFSAYDISGRLVGRDSREFVGLQHGEEGKVDIGVTDDPSSADATCSSDRLDDPDGDYGFRNIEVNPSPNPDTSASQRFIVTLDAEWRGTSEIPAPAQCILSFLAGDGSVLFHRSVNLTSKSGSISHAELPVTAPSDLDEEPMDVNVLCEPFGG